MRELRAISFTERELTTALIEFAGRLKRKLPPGTVNDARASEGPPASIVLPIQDDYGTLHEIPFSEMETAAALVHYCMSRKVRMPAKAEKSLQIIGGQATLVIWVGAQKGPKKLGRAAALVNAVP
ncbi:MAG TPA: hypothetical protein VED40_11045 [Azospirillaceae bacterium]|nr:hypothetical protein [Azospirillaceae bacterium]